MDIRIVQRCFRVPCGVGHSGWPHKYLAPTMVARTSACEKGPFSNLSPMRVSSPGSKLNDSVRSLGVIVLTSTNLTVARMAKDLLLFKRYHDSCIIPAPPVDMLNSLSWEIASGRSLMAVSQLLWFFFERWYREAYSSMPGFERICTLPSGTIRRLHRSEYGERLRSRRCRRCGRRCIRGAIERTAKADRYVGHRGHRARAE